MAEPIKLGAYICGGCGLSQRLDVDALASLADSEGQAQVVRQHAVLCNVAGVAMIRDDIANEGVSHVMIAACSCRAKTDAFVFDDVAVARANLREGAIWSQPDTDEARETTQEMAADYVRMGCAEARYMRQPDGNADVGGNRRVLVVGGGVSGMTAALEAAGAGYEVLLVEKEATLGGWAARLYRRVPVTEPFADPQDPGVTDLVSRIKADSGIAVFTQSTVTRTSGAPGQFTVDIALESGAACTENVGAIVQATGFRSHDVSALTHLGFGASPDVIDQAGLESLARAAAGGPLLRPSNGKPVENAVFIQCAGQRSETPGHLPYCSGHCCNTSIKQAMYFKAPNPAVDTAIIHSDLRTPGNGEDFYRSAQRKGVTFTKGVVSEVKIGGDRPVVCFTDLILDQTVSLAADLVVLATGQVPNTGIDREIQVIDEGGTDTGETQPPSAADVPSRIEGPIESILNLNYRQGPDVPQLAHGFSDSHFICFPYETCRTGIYTCGPVRRPMDIAQAVEDATGAALKAIQAIENAALGRAAHPRSGDLSFPLFRKEGCTQCKRCTVECPFGAIDEDEQRYPVFNESRCRRCGTCMGACPVRVISFDNYSVDTVGQQIKAVDMPDEFDEKPRILILACENDAYPALDIAGFNRLGYSAFVRVIPVRCLGSVNAIWVTDALNSGYDGIMLMGCKKGENYQCHFVKGSELAHYRMSKIGDTLQQLQLETERVETYEVEITDIHRIPALINQYAAKIDAIGMNPFKGF